MEAINSLDQSIFFFFNEMHSPFWDVIMALFTRTEYWLFFFITIIYFIIKNYRAKAVVILIILALAIVVSDQFSGLIKDTVQRLRPTHNPAIQNLVHNVLTKGGDYGFFSSHASNAFSVATFTTLVFRNRNFGVLIFLWALAVSYTRIYIGVHYPFDIATGIVFGTFVGLAAYRLLTFAEAHFMLFRAPKLSDARLTYKQFHVILIIFAAIVLTTLLIVNRLQYFDWIKL